MGSLDYGWLGIGGSGLRHFQPKMRDLLMVRDKGCLRPCDDVSWEAFDEIRTKKPVLVTITQPRNPDHHRKFWALAEAVANFDKDFHDSEDAVRWVKRQIPNMHHRYKESNGTLVIELKSINYASMDQVTFGRFYDRALWLWSERLGCDAETLLEQVDETPAAARSL